MVQATTAEITRSSSVALIGNGFVVELSQLVKTPPPRREIVLDASELFLKKDSEKN